MKEISIYDIYEQTAQKIKDKSRLTETISSVMALINAAAFSLILYFEYAEKHCNNIMHINRICSSIFSV